jgi:hypothetical protein
MAAETVRIKGLRETIRAFNKIDRSVAKEIRDELKKVAVPVAESAKSRLSRYQGLSLGTIGPKATTKSVFVTQRKRKVTGRRGDFGALQMRVGLLPALAENEDNIIHEVEQALDRLTRENGF